jgi:hypothetical protein
MGRRHGHSLVGALRGRAIHGEHGVAVGGDAGEHVGDGGRVIDLDEDAGVGRAAEVEEQLEVAAQRRDDRPAGQAGAPRTERSSTVTSGASGMRSESSSSVGPT